MITETIRRMIETVPYIFLATTNSSYQPHMAVGGLVAMSGDSLLIFENWFCPSTLANIDRNKLVAVVVINPDTGEGYQLLGSVIRSSNEAYLDGHDPSVRAPETPQVLTRFTVKVEQVLEFTGGIHSDIPIIG